MKPKLSNILIFTFAFSFLIFPLVVSAVDWLPLVPCGRSDQDNPSTPEIEGACTRCDSFKLVHNVISFILYGLVPPAAAVLFIAAGLLILLAGANPGLYARGISIFKNTFYGLLIILASWLITNTFIQSFGPDQVKDSWFKFTCEDRVIKPGGPPPSALCSNPAGLAAQYNTSSQIKNAPELNALITCVNSRLGNFIDQNKLYTFEQSNGLCNYTRGNEVCGSCAHRVNSCHYGGPSGSNGSLAVDFNAVGISERELFNRLSALRNTCNFGFILFETDHIHISTTTCAGDTGGD